MNVKYILESLILFLLLPILYIQGKKIKASVPRPPEATENHGLNSVSFQRTLRIITIRESTIVGVGLNTHKEGFTGTLAAELAKGLNLNIDWKVYVKSGYTAERIQEKIINGIPKKPVDFIVIGIGGNDAFGLSSPKK
jgi:lysophospholipase L1-like esterase